MQSYGEWFLLPVSDMLRHQYVNIDFDVNFTDQVFSLSGNEIDFAFGQLRYYLIKLTPVAWATMSLCSFRDRMTPRKNVETSPCHSGCVKSCYRSNAKEHEERPDDNRQTCKREDIPLHVAYQNARHSLAAVQGLEVFKLD